MQSLNIIVFKACFNSFFKAFCLKKSGVGFISDILLEYTYSKAFPRKTTPNLSTMSERFYDK